MSNAKVYAAFFGIYSDRTLIGVYSTKEAAQQALANYVRRYAGDLNYDEEQQVVDSRRPEIEQVDLDRVEAMRWGEGWPSTPYTKPENEP